MLKYLALLALGANAEYRSEIKRMPGHDLEHEVRPDSQPPHEWFDELQLPDSWDWGNLNGQSYLTHNLNQHIPQYCGSCWAHGAMSSFSDRIKIQRMRNKVGGPDINLSIQYILNCGRETAGSCYGGTATGAFQFVKRHNVPYATCQPYIACSADSEEGFCGNVDTECKAENVCLTCSTFKDSGGVCNALNFYPNATIDEWGTIENGSQLKSEVYARGPVACGVNAVEILEYTGGVIDMPNKSRGVDHIVSVTGWGTDTDGSQYWIVRNSWGEYWGERGFFRIKMGGNQLGIENSCSWATPAGWTEHNTACFEDGTNCLAGQMVHQQGWNEERYKHEVNMQLKYGANHVVRNPY